MNDPCTDTCNYLDTWDNQHYYTLRGPHTIQIYNTEEVVTKEKPPVCTTEEWEKFCEEEGLEDDN